jgi:uncharacterized membrane protein YcgQ (UPF0703/DUF1980 family)
MLLSHFHYLYIILSFILPVVHIVRSTHSADVRLSYFYSGVRSTVQEMSAPVYRRWVRHTAIIASTSTIRPSVHFAENHVVKAHDKQHGTQDHMENIL